MNPALKRQFEAATAVDKVVEKQKQTRGREIGTVLDYDKAKGFGFLLDADSEKIFVHQSQIVSPGFRMLVKDQKVSFLRGENRGKPWAEDVRNPDGTQISQEKPEQSDSTMAKKRRQQLKEQWRNFFEIPQYAVKGYGESLPATVANQDAFALGETVPQLGKVFVMAHGCASSSGKGNEAATYAKEKLPKFIAKAYEEKPDAEEALKGAFEVLETEFMERAKMKSLTDGAEVTAVLFVHALNASGQPCVQLWVASCGASVVVLCSHEGNPVRALEPHGTQKVSAALKDLGFNVTESGKVEVSFAEVGQLKPSQIFRMPASRLIGGRPFKTGKSPVQGQATVKKVKEWRCVAGEEPFLLVFSAEVASVLKDQDVLNVALDAWGSPAQGLDGWEAASKAVVRTAQAQGPDRDSLACLAVQCWWQEKPLQRLLAKRAEKKDAGVAVAKAAKPVDDGFDMFG
ncbi:unnamed protein product [Cladocopium goreaui]|uniref:Cold shock domain-containing protein 4 n=1 Tax=Cladocopium goreaui TaxID=2562237 RepID=A0A9P1CJZ7_9DINO|nr:unnamed protein product [Cladocopium goreaui]